QHSLSRRTFKILILVSSEIALVVLIRFFMTELYDYMCIYAFNLAFYPCNLVFVKTIVGLKMFGVV
ncbi:MAG: hypothetical protein KAI09_02745, partial [Dehalococcoidales bacterium]|nr:hypothetical protein [Dehalococcoidales bacterium]